MNTKNNAQQFVGSNAPERAQKSRLGWEDIFLKGWHPYAWIIFISLLLYSQVLFFDFSHYDDDTLIINNQQFLTTLSNIPRAFIQQVFPESHHAPYYRPMLTISFILDAQLGGLSPFVYHLTNLILHLISCCLLFLLLMLLQYRKDLSLLFSSLFAVHPILSEAVSWIPGRNDSLLTVFTLLAFMFCLRFTETRKWKYYAGYLLSLSLAIFSKEAALLIIIPILIYLRFIKRERMTSFNIKILSIGWVAIIIIWFFLRDIALAQCPIRLTIFDIAISVLRNLHQIIIYLGKIILPIKLSAFPSEENSGIPLMCGYVTIVLLLITFFITKHKRFNFIALGLCWFILFLLPALVSPNIPKLTIFALEHRIYLPLIGFIIFLLETDVIKNINLHKKSSLTTVVIIISILFVIAFLRAPIYKNRIILWETVVKESPHVAVARQNLAGIYYVEGMLDKSEIEYKKTLELNPDAQQVHYFLGLIYMRKNMYQKAIEELKKELLIKPDDEQLYFNIGIAYYKQSKFNEIESKSLETEAKELEAQGKSKEAMAKLLAVQDKLTEISNNLKDTTESWLKALELNPRIQTVHNNLGLVYMDEHKYKEAEEEFKKELLINNNYDTAFFNLGMLYYKQGNIKQAEELWQKTIKVNPNNLDAYYQLAMYYFTQKKYVESRYYVEQIKIRGVSPPLEFLKALDEKLKGK